MSFHWRDEAAEAVDSAAAGKSQDAEKLLQEILDEALEEQDVPVQKACSSGLQRLEEVNREDVHYEQVARYLKQVFEDCTEEYLPGVDEEAVRKGKRKMMDRDGVMPLSKARMDHSREELGAR